MHDRFLRACRREPVDRTPIWLMRQAGRYMAAYRAIRSNHDLLDMIKNPEVAAEVTLQPVEAFGVDAAIIFADILPVLESLGLPLRFVSGRGPVIDRPIRSAEDVRRLHRQPAAESLGFTLDAVRLVRRELNGRCPLIGFSGAPFTLACYAIEGGTSKEYDLARRFFYEQPEAWSDLMDMITDAVIDYLIEQRRAGAQALQLFDSWAGLLSPDLYRKLVLPSTSRIFSALKAPDPKSDPVPVIHFATGNPALLPILREAGGDVIGLDWRISLTDGWSAVGPEVAVQGNLDPVTLLASPEVFLPAAQDVLNQANGRPGHIFNLGHGVLKQTPEEHVQALVDYVQGQAPRPYTSPPPCA